MAKSGKSDKATDTEEHSVEKPKDAERIVSDLETELTNAAEVSDELKDEDTVEIVPQDDQDAQQPPEGQETTDSEIPDDQPEDEALDPVAEAEAESEQEIYGEADADPIETSTDEIDREDLDSDDIETEVEIFEVEDVIDPDAENETRDPEELEAEKQEDSVPEPEPEPAETKPAAAPAPQAAGGSMWPAVFGGVIAALIGFIVGRGDVIDNYLPEAFQRPDVDLSVVDELAVQTQALAEQAGAFAERSEEIAAQAQAQVSRIDALEAATPPDNLEGLETLTADLEAVAARLEALEARPEAPEVVQEDVASSEAVAALEAALEEQRAQIAGLVERAEAAEARAADEAAELLARAALTRVVTAVDSGQSFAPALTDLEEVTPVEVPEALRDAAASGVPSMAALQDSFPDAARAGLSAARAEVPESDVQGITGFLKRQLNARSVTPREGTDPDAILSRAQAAVRAGDLGSALTEIEGLPEAARAAMSDWLEAASARKAAQDAANELADSLNSN